jgi:hypothetical protein
MIQRRKSVENFVICSKYLLRIKMEILRLIMSITLTNFSRQHTDFVRKPFKVALAHPNPEPSRLQLRGSVTSRDLTLLPGSETWSEMRHECITLLQSLTICLGTANTAIPHHGLRRQDPRGGWKMRASRGALHDVSELG